MEDGYCDAMIMAAAGLERLELDHYITEILEPEVMIPATSQGVIAIESRIGDERVDQYLQKINHTATRNAIEAERGFLRSIEGGCQVPVGCYTTSTEDEITITGFVASVDGSEYLLDTEIGPISESQAIGESLAKKLIDKGAINILNSVRNS